MDKNMDNIKQLVEKNKLRAAQKRNPRYGMRKLSIGLVSCLLGYIVAMTPQPVSAQTTEQAGATDRSNTSTESNISLCSPKQT